jgi:hypothetical protein
LAANYVHTHDSIRDNAIGDVGIYELAEALHANTRVTCE